MGSWASYKLCICAFSISALASPSPPTSPKIQVPPVQPGGARSLDPHIGSLSIESCYITDFLGNPGQKNELSWNLLTNFDGEFGGLNPYLRLGGHTQDHANFDPDQKEALKNLFAEGNDEAVNVTYGSTLFTDVLLQNVPSSSKFVMGLNLKTLNVSIALETARAAWNAFSSQGQQSRLHMTVGNEPDQWGWGAEDYEPHVAEFLQTIQSELDLPKNWFQVGDLANAPDPQIVGQNWTNTFLLRRLLELGVGDAGDVWTMSQHTYPFSVCTEETAVMATLPSLLNYTHLVRHMSMFIPDITAVNAAGHDYVLGETGSVSCHGKQGVSDRFGTALYMINFMLHGASIGIKRSFFHNGTPFFYSLWRPITSNTGDEPIVNPTYGSFLFLSQVLGANGGEKSVVEIVDLRQNDLSAFAIFDADSTFPCAVVLIDSQFWSAPSRRPTRVIDINAVTGGHLAGDFSVKRLTSSHGVNATSTDFSLAGVRVDGLTGKLTGNLKAEKGHRSGTVVLNAAEAVLIEFHKAK